MSAQAGARHAASVEVLGCGLGPPRLAFGLGGWYVCSGSSSSATWPAKSALGFLLVSVGVVFIMRDVLIGPVGSHWARWWNFFLGGYAVLCVGWAGDFVTSCEAVAGKSSPLSALP